MNDFQRFCLTFVIATVVVLLVSGPMEDISVFTFAFFTACGGVVAFRPYPKGTKEES